MDRGWGRGCSEAEPLNWPSPRGLGTWIPESSPRRLSFPNTELGQVTTQTQLQAEISAGWQELIFKNEIQRTHVFLFWQELFNKDSFLPCAFSYWLNFANLLQTEQIKHSDAFLKISKDHTYYFLIREKDTLYWVQVLILLFDIRCCGKINDFLPNREPQMF